MIPSSPQLAVPDSLPPPGSITGNDYPFRTRKGGKGKKAGSAFGALIKQARAVLESAKSVPGNPSAEGAVVKRNQVPAVGGSSSAETAFAKLVTVPGAKVAAGDGNLRTPSSDADKQDVDTKKASLADRIKKPSKEGETPNTAPGLENTDKTLSSGTLRSIDAEARKVLAPQPGKGTEENESGTEESGAVVKGSERRKGGNRLDGEGSRASGDVSTENAALLGGSAFQASATMARKSAGVKIEAGDGNTRVEGSDSKKKDRRKERINLEVYDQRNSNPASSEKTQAVSGLKGAGEGSASSKDGGNAAELVVRLHGKGGEAGGDDARTSQGAKASNGSFADSLARELRENYNSDIVRRASVVLKDGGDGLIRLSLKPESLGSVKISLELTDNRIAGHIIVESEEAMRAFEKELASLEQAFRDGGFDGASLELSLSSGDSGTGSGAGRRDAAEGMKPFYSERIVAGGYDAAITREESTGFVNAASRGNALVDMLA